MRIIRTIFQGLIDHSTDLTRQRQKFTTTNTPSEQVESICTQITNSIESSKFIFEAYRVECGLNDKFLQNEDIYHLYMSVLTNSMNDKEEIVKVMKAVDHLKLEMSQNYFVRIMYFCGRTKQALLAQTVYQKMVKNSNINL